MPIVTKILESVEQWRATAFLVAGVVFVADAILLTTHISAGTEPAAFGQALIGAAWTAAFVGLLGFYPDLAENARRLAGAGAVFALVGGVTMAAMAAASLGYATNVLNGQLSDVVMFFLPGVFLGIVFGFGLFGAVALRTGTYSWRVGALCLLLVGTFLFNLTSGVAGFGTLVTVLGVVGVLALSMLTIGYLFRTGSAVPATGQAQRSTR